MDYTKWGSEPRNPPPLYATPRSNRETLGGEVAQVLERSGSPGKSLSKALLPVMPWQRDVLDVVCEIDPRTGLFWYRTIILIAPRQTGKTTMTRGKLNHRAITQPNSLMLYTAQDRNTARKRLERTIYKPLVASVLGGELIKPRWAAGSESVRWRNGSELGTEALSETAGHGDTLDEAHIDEAFAHRDNRIEQSVKPAMSTIDGAQMWIPSAAGGRNSTYLWQKVEAGRALVQLGGDSRTCYIEYGAPLGADPDDPETLLNSHPGIGHTTSLEIIWDDHDSMDAEEFQRAYYSWWPKAEGVPTPIPLAAWNANFTDPDLDTWSGEPMWCVDVSPDRTWASIALAAKSYDPAARCFVEVVDHADDGTAWICGRLKDLSARFGGRRVAIDASGAASSLYEDLTEAGFDVHLLTAHDRAAACGAMYDDAVHGRIRYVDDPVLNGAMMSALKINAYGGETWIFSRGRSQADITPLYAVTLARFAYVKFAPAYDVMETI